MLWPPPMACVSEESAPIGARRWGAGPGPQRSPLGGTLAIIAPLTFHAMDDGLSHAACGSVSLAQVWLGVSRAHPAPARGVPGAPARRLHQCCPIPILTTLNCRFSIPRN